MSPRTGGLLLSVCCAFLACGSVAGGDGAGGIDLRRFDWNRALLPGSVCATDHSIRLHSG
jgi:hypothetical protein